LTTLDVSHNRIWDSGTGFLAELLKINTKTLAVLNLDSNEIRDVGAQCLADALKLNKVKFDHFSFLYFHR